MQKKFPHLQKEFCVFPQEAYGHPAFSTEKASLPQYSPAAHFSAQALWNTVLHVPPVLPPEELPADIPSSDVPISLRRTFRFFSSIYPASAFTTSRPFL